MLAAEVCDAEHAKPQISSDARARIAEFRRSVGVVTERLVAFHEGPTAACREWPSESWGELADRFNRIGCKVIQLGSKRRGNLKKFPKAQLEGTISALDMFSLEDSIALISVCDLFVGIDSGL
ncbi:MAG: glycosyltransferase family 9 protein [Steroidobacteraceae bacterium]